jgi:hypothetical protein
MDVLHLYRLAVAPAVSPIGMLPVLGHDAFGAKSASMVEDRVTTALKIAAEHRTLFARYQEQNSDGPSGPASEPAGNTFTVRILSPDFLPEYTVAVVLYSTTSLDIKGVHVKSIKPM